MPPNNRGVCRECTTLDWECTCKDAKRTRTKREPLELPSMHESTLSNILAEEPSSSQCQSYKPGAENDPESDQDFEDVIEDAKTRGLWYGVLWSNFEPASHENALKMALFICGQSKVTDYYIGVAKVPALRFYEPPSPHCFNFKAMYVLAVGTNLRHFERRVIEACRAKKPSGLRNRSNGGEGIHKLSVRFLYICINPALSGLSS